MTSYLGRSDCGRTLEDITTLLIAISDVSDGLASFCTEARAEYEHEVASIRIFRQILHLVVYRADLLLARVEHRMDLGVFRQFYELVSDTRKEVSEKLRLVAPELPSSRQPDRIREAFAESVEIVQRKLPEFESLKEYVRQLLDDKNGLLQEFTERAQTIEGKLTQTVTFANQEGF
ncbi:MAG: hypothetical protein JSS49_02400 [Planctomycetes bacterium]|nr:hypothetical protein [Planctomycetota bacterium]